MFTFVTESPLVIRPPSDPQRSVKSTILNGFADVFGRDGVGFREVGDGAGDFQNAVVGAGAQIQFRHGDANQFLGFVAEFAVLFDLPRTHPGVAIHFRVGMETRSLFFAGVLDAVANGGGRFFGARAGDVAVFDGGHFDVEIDAIEERAGDALAITMDLGWTATTLAFQIAEVTAWTRVHRGNEHELG